MKLTMSIKRANDIMSLLVNHELCGTDDPVKLQALKKLTLAEMLEANTTVERLNERKRKRRTKYRSFSYSVTFDERGLAGLYHALHGGVIMKDVQNIIDAINDRRRTAGQEDILLVMDDTSWLETRDDREMLYQNEFYYSDRDLIRALNTEYEKADKLADAKEAEEHV